MINKQAKYDRDNFIENLFMSCRMIPSAEEIGDFLFHEKIKQVYLVGCGAPHYMFRVLTYWADKLTTGVEVKNLYPAELVHIKKNLPEDTAVIFGSHSGKTYETVQVAELLRSESCYSIAITQFSDSPLADQVQEVISYGETEQGYFSSYIIAQILISTFLQKATNNWKIHDILKASLINLPIALADAKQESRASAFSQAKNLQNSKNIYVIGGGPMYTTAYIFAACFLMEMQHLHAHPVNALDFFHGPFEVVDSSVPLILLLGEGKNRPEVERILKFCDRYTDGCITYDSSQFEMTGIHKDIRPIVAPFIVDAALTNLVEQLAILRGHPMDTRRYMGKVDY